jgi:5-methylcytosine-specific restriction endonuclease McrA
MLSSYLATRRARQLKAEGDYTPADVAKLRAEQDDRCVYCRVDLARKGHVDHIIPLSKGGSNWPSNLQLLCRSCNSKKGAKHPDEFAKIIGFDVRRAGHASQR